MSEPERGARRFFIAGTDTGVGKTFVTVALLRALNAEGCRAVGYKPLCCGDRGDALALFEASAEPAQGELTIDAINPCWLKMPAAPLVAARIENREIDRRELLAAVERLECDFGYDHVLIEGAGGWEVPLAPGGVTMANLAVDFSAPVLLVVDNKLGALNHTLLTVAAIERCGLRCAGIFLNHCQDERDSASISNRVVLEEMLPQVPVLAELLHGETTLDLDGRAAVEVLSGS